MMLLEASLAVLAVAAVLWPITALVRRHYRAPFRLTGLSAVLYRLVRLTAVVDVCLAIGWVVLISLITKNITILNDPLDPWLRAVQVLAALGVLGALAGVLNLVRYSAMTAVAGGQKSPPSHWPSQPSV